MAQVMATPIKLDHQLRHYSLLVAEHEIRRVAVDPVGQRGKVGVSKRLWHVDTLEVLHLREDMRSIAVQVLQEPEKRKLSFGVEQKPSLDINREIHFPL